MALLYCATQRLKLHLLIGGGFRLLQSRNLSPSFLLPPQYLFASSSAMNREDGREIFNTSSAANSKCSLILPPHSNTNATYFGGNIFLVGSSTRAVADGTKALTFGIQLKATNTNGKGSTLRDYSMCTIVFGVYCILISPHALLHNSGLREPVGKGFAHVLQGQLLSGKLIFLPEQARGKCVDGRKGAWYGFHERCQVIP